MRAFIDRSRSSPLADADELCRRCVLRLRSDQILDQLASERGALTAVEEEVARKAASHETIASHLDDQFRGATTRGQALADSVARVGGSWSFVLCFLGGLAVWMFINTALLASKAFDPYPYILLNLALSCVAALQAPIIMMSQNRVAARDRMQADQDFRVNLKAEIEIAGLHEKVDHLLHEQWESLLALQQAQMDLLEDLSDRLGASKPETPTEDPA